ncbi:MAG: TfoX/Sxy family protein [Alphaproteobacteria bacterium]
MSRSGSRFVDQLVAKLTPLGPAVPRKMFGGYGIYLDGSCFGIVAGDTLFFKVDDRSRRDFEAAGTGPFQPWDDRPTVLKSFYEVPEPVLNDGRALCDWARRAVAAAHAAATSRPRKKRRSHQNP